jgi:glycosyltransferase 2 family protein
VIETNTNARPVSAVRKWALLAARLLLVGVIYLVIFRSVSLREILPLLTPAFGWALAAGVVLNLLQAASCTVRWRLLARSIPQRPGFLHSFAAYLEGLFFNQALPSFIGGDALRMLRWRAFGVSIHGAFVAVLRDRLFGAIGAAVLAVFACQLLWEQPIPRLTVLGALGLGLAALGGGAGVLLVIQSRRVTRWLSRFARLHGILHRISDKPLGIKVYGLATVYSIAGQLLSGFSVLLVARSIGIELPATLLVMVTGIILVVSMIPISFAGWGVREASFLTLLTPLGAAPERVMLLGISLGLISLLGALPGGLSILAGWSRPKTMRADKLSARVDS